MEDSHKQLKQYFLGNLDEESSEAIGVKIISDPSFEDDLRTAEAELMEDFIEKNLTPEEEKLFYENFLISEDRVNDLKEISLLKSYAKNFSDTKNLTKHEKDSKSGFWQNFKDTFSLNLRPVTVIISVGLILCLIGISWIYFQNLSPQTSPLEKEFAELNRKDLTNLSEYSNYTNISLISGTSRDSTALPKLNINNLTEKIFFRLPLPVAVTEKDLLNLEVLSNQNPIFTQKKNQIYKNPNGQEMRIFLPKSIFQKGQFQIKLENPNSSLAPFIYNFAVE